MKQHFEILGIKLGTTTEEIKNSYKNLMKQNHPDKFHYCTNKKQEAEEKAKAINVAYKAVYEFNKKVDKKFLSVSGLRQAIKREKFNN